MDDMYLVRFEISVVSGFLVCNLLRMECMDFGDYVLLYKRCKGSLL